MRFLVSICALFLLTGCAGHDRLEGPIVDLSNVDPAKYNTDLSQCRQRKIEASFVGSARIITDCMAERGYTVLSPQG